MEKKYIVSEDALPQGLLKVCRAWELIRSGKARSVSEAVKAEGISRSAYYKYRGRIRPYDRSDNEELFVVQAVLEDRAGVLTTFLNVLAKASANVKTVNQNMPVNGEAGVTVTASSKGMKISREIMIRRLCAIEGVLKAEIILG